MANTSTGDFFSDMMRGVGAGMASYDPNNPMRSLGTSILGGMARSEEDKSMAKKSEADYQNWLRKYEVSSEAEREERGEERDFRKEMIREERQYAASEAENAVERALRQLTESLDIQRRAKASERADLRAERGQFNAMNIDNLLYEAVGKYAPNYAGSPRGQNQPTMAWGGGTIS